MLLGRKTHLTAHAWLIPRNPASLYYFLDAGACSCNSKVNNYSGRLFRQKSKWNHPRSTHGSVSSPAKPLTHRGSVGAKRQHMLSFSHSTLGPPGCKREKHPAPAHQKQEPWNDEQPPAACWQGSQPTDTQSGFLTQLSSAQLRDLLKPLPSARTCAFQGPGSPQAVCLMLFLTCRRKERVEEAFIPSKQ